MWRLLLILTVCFAAGCKEKTPTGGGPPPGVKEEAADRPAAEKAALPVAAAPSTSPRVEKPEIQTLDQLAEYVAAHPETFEEPNVDLLLLRFPGALSDTRIVGVLRSVY